MKYLIASDLHGSSSNAKFLVDRFNELIKDLEACDYENNNIIVVDENNMLKDGQHRLAILCKEYGIDYKVKVLRLYCGGPKK